MSERALHFLVVDDDDQSRATVVEYLRSMGYEKITTASDGSEGVRMLDRDATINFVISDWDMPLMNGLTLLQRVRANPARAHLPFLIMTSPISDEAEKIVLAAESMVDAYMIKPFRSQSLKDKIEKMLETPIHGPQKQAIVVDDDNDARAMIVEYLKKLGFKQILPFEDGKAALDYLKENPSQVGLIVSDWEMPQLSGIELLRHCKGTPALSEVPFLMVTSQSSMERMKVVQAAKANVDQYLLKPFGMAEMKDRISTVLDKSRNRFQVQRLTTEAIDHMEHGRHQSAQNSYEQAIALDPTYDMALRGLADVLIRAKGVEQAMPFYKRAVESNPYNLKNYLRLGAAYEQVGLFDKAIALLQTARSNIPFNADLHFHLGRLYNKKGELEFARIEFEKVLEIQLDHQEARLMLEMINSTRKGQD